MTEQFCYKGLNPIDAATALRAPVDGHTFLAPCPNCRRADRATGEGPRLDGTWKTSFTKADAGSHQLRELTMRMVGPQTMTFADGKFGRTRTTRSQRIEELRIFPRSSRATPLTSRSIRRARDSLPMEHLQEYAHVQAR